MGIGFEIAKRALLAHRQAMDTASHNIANANTPGYSRQRVNLVTTSPHPSSVGINFSGVGQVGTGVAVDTITRLRDSFLDRQYWNQHVSLGEWENKEKVFTEIEELINEPSDISIHAAMGDLWVSWQTLANNPESMAARESVKQRALNLVETFKATDQKLREIQDNLNTSLEAKVKELNTLADDIASLNEQIAYITGTGLQANDLEDQRDLLLDRLSRITGFSVVNGENGIVRVVAGGVALVDGIKANHLLVERDAGNNNYWRLRWDGFASNANLNGGEIGAYLELRDNAILGYRDEIRQLAWSMATETNALHAAGYDLNGAAVAGQPWEQFFTVDPVFSNFSLDTFAVNPQIGADVRHIAAASQAGSPGDGSGAAAIASLKQASMGSLGDVRPDDYFRAVIARLGAESQQAQRRSGTYQVLVEKVDNQRQSVSGVNLDEEMVEMMRSQQAFEAAARIVTTMDEMMDTIINRLGR